MPTIWMNITTSTNWNRPPVGIVRVERSLCEELGHLYGAQFRKCIWKDGIFTELASASEIDETAYNGYVNSKEKKEQKKSNLPPIFPILSRRQAVRAMVQGCMSLLPRRLQPYFNRFLYKIRPHVIGFLIHHKTKSVIFRTANKARVWLKKWGSEAALNPIDIEQNSLFSPGDILISVGLDWDYDYYKTFYSLRASNGVKVVTCCYDLIPVLYPQYCVNDVASLFMSYFIEIADGSDLILCISKQTESDLSGMLLRTGAAQPQTCVFPLGDNVPKSENDKNSSEVMEVCRAPFILFVSTIERRKNHETLYKAYHRLAEEGKLSSMPKLVFAGMQGWGVDELLKDIELDPLTENMIVRLNYVSDDDLAMLYGAAEFCVFPSLYEGWGLPIGEALSLGKIVIASNKGSIPEVGLDSVIYIDPWDVKKWADEMYLMVTDKARRELWAEKVRKNYIPREWSSAAVTIKDVIENKIIQNKEQRAI